MKFQVIVADPPWSFNDKLKMSETKRGAEANYSTLSIDYMCNELSVRKLADENGCFIALWTPAILIEDGLRLLDAWGFDYKGVYVWAKVNSETNKQHFGMGHYFRSSCELALLGKSGKIKVENKSQRNVLLDEGPFEIVETDEPLKHSKKTEKLQDSLDLMFPSAEKLELFARRKRENWECVGLECNNEDVFQSIERLSKL